MSLKILVGPSASPTITLSGRLDTNTAPDLDRELDRVFTDKAVQRLTFDLGALEYLSSAGIRCFVRARKTIEPRGGRIALVNPQPGVRKVLEIVKAVPPGGLFASIEELDAYLDEMQRKVSDPD